MPTNRGAFLKEDMIVQETFMLKKNIMKKKTQGREKSQAKHTKPQTKQSLKKQL